MHSYVLSNYSNGLVLPWDLRDQVPISNVVLAGLVYIICEIYIDDVLIHGRSEKEFLVNLRKVLDGLKFNITANPKKNKTGFVRS